jgi:hypothetical protein
MNSVVWLRSQDGCQLVAAVAVSVERQTVVADGMPVSGAPILCATMPDGTEWAVGTFPILADAQDELCNIEEHITHRYTGVYQVRTPPTEEAV